MIRSARYAIMIYVFSMVVPFVGTAVSGNYCGTLKAHCELRCDSEYAWSILDILEYRKEGCYYGCAQAHDYCTHNSSTMNLHFKDLQDAQRPFVTPINQGGWDVPGEWYPQNPQVPTRSTF